MKYSLTNYLCLFTVELSFIYQIFYKFSLNFWCTCTCKEIKIRILSGQGNFRVDPPSIVLTHCSPVSVVNPSHNIPRRSTNDAGLLSTWTPRKTIWGVQKCKVNLRRIMIITYKILNLLWNYIAGTLNIIDVRSNVLNQILC